MSMRIPPRLLGFSLYWAWMMLCFKSTVAFLPWAGPAAVHTVSETFFTCSLVACVVAHLGWAWIAHRFPREHPSVGWVAAVLMSASILYAGVWATPGVWEALVIAGIVSGIASAYLDVRWSQAYGFVAPETSGRAITLSIGLGIAGYFVLSALGLLVSPFACVAAIACLPFACVAALRIVVRHQETQDDRQLVPPTHNARQIIAVIWRPVAGSLIFFFIFGCSAGIVSERTDFNVTQGLSLACELLAVLLFFACLCRQPRPSMTRIYGAALVLIAAGFMVLPLVMRGQGAMGAAAASLLVNVGVLLFDVLLLCMIAYAAYDFRTSGAVINGLVRGATMGASAVGHIAGSALADSLWSGAVDIAAFVLAITYLLIVSASFFLGLRRREAAASAPTNEPVAPPPTACAAPTSQEQAEQLESLLDQRIDAVGAARNLSHRETEVLGLLARGRSLPYIAETLVLSENTVRSHARRIYNKLGVHSKQELLDLVQNSADNQAAPVDTP